jgi:hypothetical protein
LSLVRGHLHAFHIYFAAEYWASTQRACLAAAADPALGPRIHLLKYEELIARPDEVMRHLMQFIGLEFEGRQTRYFEDERVVDHARRSKFWRNLAHPIDGSNKGKYKDGLGLRNIEIFESVAFAEMEALGYPLDTAHQRTFSPADVRLYRAVALIRKTFWSMDPSAEGFRIRARVRATRRIIDRAPLS